MAQRDRIDVRLRGNDLLRIDELCALLGCSRSAIVRTLTRIYLDGLYNGDGYLDPDKAAELVRRKERASGR